MRRMFLALAFSMLAGSAYASCKSEAAGLSGAAKTAFLKKCQAVSRAKARATPAPQRDGDYYSQQHKYRPMATDER